MLLWVSIALLTLLVTTVVVWPLFSRKPIPGADDDLERRLAVFRDRRKEIGREREAGRLTEGEAAQALTDLLRQMAEELPPEVLGEVATGAGSASASAPMPASSTKAAAAHTRGPMFAGLALAVLLPIVAIGAYRVVGSPEIALAQLEGRLDELADNPQARFDALVGQIEARLRADPRDGEAWAVLAHAYKTIGNHGAAIEAFGKAVSLLPPDARLLAEYAESSALAAGGDFRGRPTELLEQALAADPNDSKAIALMGAAHYRAGDLPQARRYLVRLLDGLPPGSEDAARLGEVLKRIDSELAAHGILPQGPTGAQAGPKPGESAVAPGSQALFGGRVEIAPALAGKLPSGATLFVIARATQGPRTPLAVLRQPANALPYAFELRDTDAMDPSRRLSSVGEIALEARISLSGDAARRPGDLVGEPIVARPGRADLELLIDRVVEP